MSTEHFVVSSCGVDSIWEHYQWSTVDLELDTLYGAGMVRKWPAAPSRFHSSPSPSTATVTSFYSASCWVVSWACCWLWQQFLVPVCKEQQNLIHATTKLKSHYYCLKSTSCLLAHSILLIFYNRTAGDLGSHSTVSAGKIWLYHTKSPQPKNRPSIMKVNKIL